MKNYFLFTILLISIQAAFAQDSLKHSILTVGAGLNYILNKDEFHSNYTYKGINPTLHIAYSRDKPKGIHAIDAKFSIGKFKSIVSPMGKNYIHMLNYSYLFKIIKSPKLLLAAGGGVGTFITSVNYIPNIDFPRSNLTGNISLKFTAKIAYKINHKSIVSLSSNIPIAGKVYRPDFDYNGKTFLGNNFIMRNPAISINLGYEYKLNSKYSFSLNYTYSFFSYHQPRSVAIMQNGFHLNIKRTF